MQGKIESILNYTKKEIEELVIRAGYERYRSKQIQNYIYQQGVYDFEEMQTLPKGLRDNLKRGYTVISLKEVDRISSRRGGETTKVVYELADGNRIESVVIREGGRKSLCISSQAGCPLACTFCATGTMGLKRSLYVDEIVGQYLLLKKENKKLDNIIYMGMGEPFLNYANVRGSIMALLDTELGGYGARRITVSTAGIARGIQRLADDEGLRNIRLAVSLTTLNQKLRKEIMPIAKKIDIKELLNALRYYTRKTGKRITLEYIMLAGVNMGKEDAKDLIKLYNSELKFNLNLIPYNKIEVLEGAPLAYEGKSYEQPSMGAIKYFKNYFKYTNLEVVERKRKGREIKAACGQLVQRG